MSNEKQMYAYWIFIIFLAISIIMMLVGQTMSVFNYDLTVKWGLQESLADVGEFGVQVNRSFGASDTIVYVPLLLASLIGLLKKKRWSLLMTAATAGVSAYWSATILFIFLFAPGAAGYNYNPPVDIWIFVLAYLVFGVWGLAYLLIRGERLIKK
jgi:hypothetical protein